MECVLFFCLLSLSVGLYTCHSERSFFKSLVVLFFCLLSPSVGLYTCHSVRSFFKSLVVLFFAFCLCWSLHQSQCMQYLQKSRCLVFCLLSLSVGLYTCHSVRCFFKSLAVSLVTGTNSGCISVHVHIFRQNRSTSTFSRARFLCR